MESDRYWVDCGFAYARHILEAEEVVTEMSDFGIADSSC